MCCCRGKTFRLTSRTSLMTHSIHQNTCMRKWLRLTISAWKGSLVFPRFGERESLHIQKVSWFLFGFVLLEQTVIYYLIDVATILKPSLCILGHQRF